VARFEGVRHIKDDIYEINFRPYSKAKRVFKRIQANSMQEAYLKRAEELTQYIHSSNVSEVAQERRNATLDRIADIIINDLRSDGKAKKTINRFTGCWKTFCQFLSEKHPGIDNLNKLKVELFKDYQDYIVLERGREKGWRAEIIILQALFNRLRVRGYVSPGVINELKQIKRPRKGAKKDYKDIPDSDIRRLINHIEKDRPDYYGITVFIYKCGWRIDETTLLKKADIRWNGLMPLSITIKGETTKTKVTRIFDTFDGDLKAVVKKYAFDRRKTVWLFPNQNNNHHSAGKYRDYLKRVSRKIIGHEITPHYFRHRLCTVAGRNNLNIADLQAITGIKDIKVLLDYYQHTTAEGKAKVLALSNLK